MAGLALLAPASAPAAPADAGSVRFVRPAESSFDRFTRKPAEPTKRFMRARYWRMRTYSPYFDRRLGWFRNAWVYQDLYAIYRGSREARRHPEWILRDRHGRRLYIPFGCRGGRCPQYAADISHPGFRRHWIRSARRKLRRGYRGLFVDDVNMIRRVGDGRGRAVLPRSRGGRAVGERRWRALVAQFTAEIRRSFRRREIVHNAIWYAPRDRYVRRQTRAADWIELERGFNDGGIGPGLTTFGIERFLSQIDWVHGQRRHVILDGRAEGETEREYGLAGLFLASSTRDALGNDEGATPARWWRGYEVRLGAARGSRYRWHGLLRRDFEHGLALLNEPGAPVRTVELPSEFQRAGGKRVRRVRLGPATGVVLRVPKGAPTKQQPSPPCTLPLFCPQS